MPPPVIEASKTRAPSTPVAKVTKITTYTTAFSQLIPIVLPDFPNVLVVAFAGGLAGLVNSIGGEVRDIQHTYEEGMKREDETQGPFAEFIMNLLGRVL